MRDQRDELVLQPVGFDQLRVLLRELILRLFGERTGGPLARPDALERAQDARQPADDEERDRSPDRDDDIDVERLVPQLLRGAAEFARGTRR